MSVKKILALLLAAMMVFGMTSAMAANETVLTDGTGAAGAATTTATTLDINKWVVVENPVPSITVAYPAMEFTYTVAPKAPATGADVTDADGDVGAVTEGVAGGVTITNTDGKVTIPAATVLLNDKGQEIVGAPLHISVDLTKFTTPGIFRYAITDTTESSYLINKGVVRDTALDKEFILDVYIKNTSTTGEFVPGVAGYVLTHDEVEHINGETEKDSGFDKVNVVTTEVPGQEGQPGTTTNKLDNSAKAAQTGNDFYYTYNATLSKTISGAMADANNTFKFDLAITNKNLANDTLTYYVDARNADKAADPALKAENLAIAYLKGGDTATIYGLNPYATVKYTETNNTASAYTVTVFDGADTGSTTGVAAATTAVTKSNLTTDGTPSTVEGNQSILVPAGKVVTIFNTATTVVTWADAAKAANTAAQNVKYNNDLPEISPTGVVLRFAPYMAMFAAGCVLFLILATKRSKKEEE